MKARAWVTNQVKACARLVGDTIGTAMSLPGMKDKSSRALGGVSSSAETLDTTPVIGVWRTGASDLRMLITRSSLEDILRDSGGNIIRVYTEEYTPA